MKVEYITKFYKKLEELGLELDSDCLDSILLLDEETIDVLLNSDLANRFDGIKILLKNQKLTKLEYFSRVIKIIASCPDECYVPAFGVANNDDVIESGYCAVLTEKVASAKTKATAENARNTAINIKKIGKIGLWEAVQIVELIANASSDLNSTCAYAVAIDDNAIHSNSLTELVEILAKAENGASVLLASHVARNKNAIKSGHVTQLTKIVTECKNANAEFIKKVAIDQDATKSSDIVKLAKIVANSKEENGEYAQFAATNYNILESGLVVELTKIIANSKKGNATYAYDVAMDDYAITTGKVVELTKIVANAKNSINAKYASEVAYDCDMLEYDNINQIVKTIADAPNNDKAECARDVSLYLSNFEIDHDIVLDLIKIIMKSKDYVIPALSELLADDDVIASGKILELAKIISSATNDYNAQTASAVACNTKLIRLGYVEEFTKLVVEAKNTYNVDYVAYNLIDNLNEENCNEVYELAKIFASANEAKLTFLDELLNENVNINDVLLIAKAIENIRLNKNNIDMVVSLIITGDYNKSEKPIESIVSILKSTSDYIVFKDAYEIDPANAIKGLTTLDKEFKGIDIKDTKNVM